MRGIYWEEVPEALERVPNTIITPEIFTRAALDSLFDSQPKLNVWDGDVYRACPCLVDEDGPNIGRVRYVCGKCGDSTIAAAGDVCEFCWAVAVSVVPQRPQRIGETINVRRPMRFK